MLVSGIVVASVGAALLVSGGILFAQGQAASAANAASGTTDDDANVGGAIETAAGILMLIVGGLHVLVGLPLIGNGAQPPSRATTPPQAVSWMVPSVGGGPRSTGLRWTF
jgi:hypothetical protein